MITNSLEWPAIESDLIKKSKNLSNYKDIRKMIENINKEVSNLSKAEVDARRTKRPVKSNLINTINQNIELVQEYILIASLIG